MLKCFHFIDLPTPNSLNVQGNEMSVVVGGQGARHRTMCKPMEQWLECPVTHTQAFNGRAGLLIPNDLLIQCATMNQ